MPVIVVVADPGVVIAAVTGPLTWVQVPVPETGVFADIVAVPADAQID
jgi:hypothetical protein